MAYTKSKYTAAQTQEMEMRALDVVENGVGWMTIDEICSSDIILKNCTPQKMARVLSKMNEVGIIEKGKRNGRVAYRRKDYGT